MEDNAADVETCTKPRHFTKKLFRNGTVLLLAIAFAYTHYNYVSTLFENDRNFSHLSELEREMALRTEMGFYYSYYKTIVQERPFLAAVNRIMYDRLVEYPTEVNAFNRFNIYPEVFVGFLYRYFEPWVNSSRVCHLVKRMDMTPVTSCVGAGEPIMFYLNAAWTLAGVMVAAVFLHAVTLSESILGGVLAVTQYFANHEEATRVQWAPNERENWAAPLLFLQTWLLTVQLRDQGKRISCTIQVTIFILNCLCLMFWQFTQFIFFTQTAIFFIMEQLKIIDLKTLCVFLHSHFCGLHMAVLMLHGNDMLRSSLYTALFLTVSAYCMFFSFFRIKVKTKLDFFIETFLVAIRISVVAVTTVYLKMFMTDFLEVDEDSHIINVLYSKFTDYKSFHTLIYTCLDVFDFLPLRSVMHLIETLLLPMALLGSANVLSYWLNKSIEKTMEEYSAFTNGLKSTIKKITNENDDEDDSGIENNAETTQHKRKVVAGNDNGVDSTSKMAAEQNGDEIIGSYWLSLLKNIDVDAAIFYNLAQMAVFGVMAVLVMRFKLLFVTQMCVVSSLIMDSKYYSKSRLIVAFWVLCGPVVFHHLQMNLSKEMAHIGEFSDAAQEELLQWIAQSPGGAYAGSMPLMATVMLATRRPIVAHPHYESKGARDRAYTVYKTYGRFTPDELYRDLTALKASYLIVEKKYCYGHSSKGCTYGDIWDIEAPDRTNEPHLCHTLLTEPTDHFYRVFSNDEYAVFRIHDLSVRYMPRSFDT